MQAIQMPQDMGGEEILPTMLAINLETEMES
jgi:hypothetical protein